LTISALADQKQPLCEKYEWKSLNTESTLSIFTCPLMKGILVIIK